MNNEISILPTYSEQGSVVILLIERLDDNPIGADELADALETYVELLRVSPDHDRAN